MFRSRTSVLEYSAEIVGTGIHGYLKGKSALMVYDRHPELGNKFERDFWARGYYVSTVGNVDEETIKKYIKEQQEESYEESRAVK